MAYQESAGLGDVASEIASGLDALRNLAGRIQSGGDALAERIRSAGDYAVRLSNAATGAAAGAKAGGAVPARPGASLVTPALLIGGAWLLLSSSRRRRR